MTVAALRAAIASSEELRGLEGLSTARLVVGGRLLADSSAQLASAGVVDGAHVLVALSGGGGGGGGGGLVAGTAAPAIPALQADAVRAFRGFDRLRALGLDADGVALLRSQFLAEVIEADLARPRNLPGETEAERLLRNEVRFYGERQRACGRPSSRTAVALKWWRARVNYPLSHALCHPYSHYQDAWIVTQGDDSDFALNLRPLVANAGGNFAGALGGVRGGELGIPDGTMQEGSMASLLFGFVIGYVLGFIAIFLTLSGPSTTRRFRVGIFVGILMSIFTTAQGAANEMSSNDTGGAGSEAAGAAAKNDSPWSAAASSIINT